MKNTMKCFTCCGMDAAVLRQKPKVFGGSKSAWTRILNLIALVAVIGFSMIACDDDWGSPPGSSVPAAPTGLTAYASSSSQIILSWNSVSGATGYYAYASYSYTGPFTLLGTVTSNGASHSSLPPNTTIYYRVTAYNIYGESDYSNIVSATTSSSGGYGLETDPIPLALNVWAYGSISSSTGAVWYSFNAYSGTTYYVWLDDSDNSDGMMDAKIAAYYSNGSPIFDEDTNSRAFTAATSGTVKIKVYPYSSGTGSFAVAYSTSSTRPGSSGHTHTYSSTWTTNSTQHWRECTAGDGARTDQGNHTFSGNICTVCSYNNGGSSHTHTYSSTYSYDETQHWRECTAGDGARTSVGNHSAVNPCTTCGYSSGGNPNPSAFTSISAFSTWLTGQPTNTRATAYNVRINVSDLGGAYQTSGSLGYVLRASANANKYVNIDLSGGSITAIPQNALRSNSTLAGVTIGGNVLTIGANAFQDCTGLTSVTMGSSITVINSNAFAGCTNLSSLTIGSGVTTIGESAFYGCDSLPSVTIPNSVTSIGNTAFYTCTTLASVTFAATSKVTSIGTEAFRGCNILNNVTIPNSVTSIGGGAFRNCLILNNLTIGNSVESIGNYAFYGCTSLTSITIPNSVTSIGEYAFAYCTNLTTATIGSGVANIGRWAFYESTNLNRVTFLRATATIGTSNPFRGDLRAKYLAGGAGTYTRVGETWTKQ